LSEFWSGRALRTPEWTFVATAPRETPFKPVANSSRYHSFQLYNNHADPHQLTNLAGHKGYAPIEAELRNRLKQRLADTGDPSSDFLPSLFPYA
jgi:arylsulfatase A-like enzyme